MSAGATCLLRCLSAIPLHVLSLFRQRSPLLSKFSKCPTYFLIACTKRFFGTYGGARTAFLVPQTHSHFRTGPRPHAVSLQLTIKTDV